MDLLSQDIPLQTPIARPGAEPIAAVRIVRPKAGHMRGLALSAVLRLDVNALVTLLPRVTQPALLPHEVDDLEPGDLLALGGAIAAHFITPAQVSQILAGQSLS